MSDRRLYFKLYKAQRRQRFVASLLTTAVFLLAIFAYTTMAIMVASAIRGKI